MEQGSLRCSSHFKVIVTDHGRHVGEDVEGSFYLLVQDILASISNFYPYSTSTTQTPQRIPTPKNNTSIYMQVFPGTFPEAQSRGGPSCRESLNGNKDWKDKDMKDKK
jgi:hypothetical protein